jgi:hypothetical protein
MPSPVNNLLERGRAADLWTSMWTIIEKMQNRRRFYTTNPRVPWILTFNRLIYKYTYSILIHI